MHSLIHVPNNVLVALNVDRPFAFLRRMTQSASIHDLSQELLDEIIDHLHDDKHSLSACCEVSTSFQRRAQQHLFREITFKSNDQRPAHRIIRTRHFYNIVQSRPHIANYVRKLEVVVTPSDNTWIHEDDIFLKIVNQFDAMEEISLEDHDYSIGKPPGPTFEDCISLVNKFWQPFVQARVTMVCLRHMIRVPLGIIGNCPRLKSLTLFSVSFDSPFSAPGFPLLPLRLDSLVYFNSQSAFWRLKLWTSVEVQQFLDMRNLTRLKCSLWKEADAQCILQVLIQAKNSIKALDINLGDNGQELNF